MHVYKVAAVLCAWAGVSSAVASDLGGAQILSITPEAVQVGEVIDVTPNGLKVILVTEKERKSPRLKKRTVVVVDCSTGRMALDGFAINREQSADAPPNFFTVQAERASSGDWQLTSLEEHEKSMPAYVLSAGPSAMRLASAFACGAGSSPREVALQAEQTGGYPDTVRLKCVPVSENRPGNEFTFAFSEKHQVGAFNSIWVKGAAIGGEKISADLGRMELTISRRSGKAEIRLAGFDQVERYNCEKYAAPVNRF